MENQIKLYYGWQETECGIFHSFQAEDPDRRIDDYEDIAICEKLARELDTSYGDTDFNCNSMYINLPESLVAKIKADGVREYLAKTEKE